MLHTRGSFIYKNIFIAKKKSRREEKIGMTADHEPNQTHDTHTALEATLQIRRNDSYGSFEREKGCKCLNGYFFLPSLMHNQTTV